MTNKIDDRAFRFTAHTIIVVFGRRTVGRFGGFCIVDVNVQNFLGHTHDVYYTLSHKYYSYADLVRDCLLLDRIGSHGITCNNHAPSVIDASHALGPVVSTRR